VIVVEQPTLPVGGEIVPGCTVLRHVNRSRMFDIYEVWSVDRHCRCAAKVVRPDRAHEAKGHRRLTHEGRLLLRLTHPNIVRAYELAPEPHPVLILEALPGMTLSYWVAEQGPLQVSDVVHVGEHLCSAVAYLHHNDVVHVDLKPGNLLCSFGILRAIDLSLAQAPGPGRRGVGTHKYLAPEQALGGTLGEATDVWGIGVVLWEAAAGRSAFERNADDPERYEQLERRAEPIRNVRRLPRALADGIDSCLEPAPSERPTVRALSEVIDSFL
jgi:serine/threonine protein kinase